MIKSLEVVGADIYYRVGRGGVTEINELSAMLDNGYFHHYEIIGEGDKKLAKVENCPVVVTYEE